MILDSVAADLDGSEPPRNEYLKYRSMRGAVNEGHYARAIAADGVADFLRVVRLTPSPWPDEPPRRLAGGPFHPGGRRRIRW